MPAKVAPPMKVDPQVVDVLKALAHPVRLRVMQILANKREFGMEEEGCCALQEVCVCRLNEQFDISAPTMSHHLKLLREAGLIESRRDGVWIYYSIRPGVLTDLARLLWSLEPGDS